MYAVTKLITTILVMVVWNANKIFALGQLFLYTALGMELVSD